MTTTQRRAATYDRQRTEELIEAAALRLLARDGILAGLNLREVADEAGVNRGLTYHYYGSRRELLQATLRRAARARRDGFVGDYELPLQQRLESLLRDVIASSEAVRLVTILLLDGDLAFPAMPLRERARLALSADKDSGALPEDVDIDAVHVLAASAAYGYALFADSFAASLDRTREELDEAVPALFARAIARLAADPGPEPS